MELDELKVFLDSYAAVVEREYAAGLQLTNILSTLTRCAVAASQGLARINEEESYECLPYPYRCLSISGWHIEENRAYVFIDAPAKKAGLVLTGYEHDSRAKQRFLGRWTGDLKDVFSALDPWFEYDNAALDMARKGLEGHCGDPLPANMTPEAVSLINDDPEAFQRRVRQSA